MRAVIQRCERANILAEINGTYIDKGTIGQGLVVFLGIETDDGPEDLQYLVRKIKDMRIFNDSEKKMNLSLADISSDLAVVSQFTLHANTRKGNRHSFIRAATPNLAKKLYDEFIVAIREDFKGRLISGEFGAMMKIDFINDGPVTIILDSKNKDF